MNVNMLIQIDKLVQLLESPVFTCKLRPMRMESHSNRTQISAYSSLNQSDIRICTSASTAYSCCFRNQQHLQRSKTA